MSMDVRHETLRLAAEVPAPVAEVWAAFADPLRRVEWSIPAGERAVYDRAEFRVGGRDEYRCGPPGELDVDGRVEYAVIDSESLVTYAEVVSSEGAPLAASLVTWRFAEADARTRVEVTSQVTSFVGEGMIDGHRKGHALALEQLVARFASAS